MFKGKKSRYFLLQVFFSLFVFPWAPDNSIIVISIFPHSKIRENIRNSSCTAGVVDAGGKLTIDSKFNAGFVDTGGAPGVANIFANFRKNCANRILTDPEDKGMCKEQDF
jgi:hypothetical protein